MQKHEKRNRRRVKTTLGVTGALLGVTLTGAALTGASPQREDDTRRASATEFPFTTFTRTQKVHLNAANVQDPPNITDPVDTTNPPNIKGAAPCRVLFRLFDSEGRVVAAATSMLEAGKTGQLVFQNPVDTADPPPIIPGMRGELQVSERCSDAVLGSMEIIDTANGEVRAVIAPTKSLRVPQNNPPDATPQ